jgi:hypothetical protein
MADAITLAQAAARFRQAPRPDMAGLMVPTAAAPPPEDVPDAITLAEAENRLRSDPRMLVGGGKPARREESGELVVDPGKRIPDLGVASYLKDSANLWHDQLRGIGPGPVAGVVRGYQRGASGFYNSLANLADIYRGLIGNEAMPTLGQASEDLRAIARRGQPVEQPNGPLVDRFSEGLGQAAVDLPQYLVGGELLGPVKGMAVIGGVHEADKGPVAAAKGAAEGALTGGVLRVAEPLTFPARAGTLAATGAAQAAASGGDTNDIVANALLMAGLGGTRTSGVRLRDIPGMALEHYLPGGDRAAPPPPARPIERIEPTLNVPPLEKHGAAPVPGIVQAQGAAGSSGAEAYVTFPDLLHFQLYQHGAQAQAGAIDQAERTRLFDALKGWADPPLVKPEDVDELAADYATGVQDQAGSMLKAGRQAGEETPLVVDSSKVDEYHRRQIGSMLRGERPQGPVAPVSPPPPAPVAGPVAGTQVAGARPEGAPQAPASPEAVAPPRAAPGAPQIVTAPGGRKIEVAPRVVEADRLITSHTPDLAVNPAFPVELQPRERARAASEAQIGDIARNLDPALLGDSPTTTDGAPIVGPDGIVESGNARVLAIRRAYDQHPRAAQHYRDFLTSQGHDIAGMREPVLVRERTTELPSAERAKFAAESNQRTTLAMGAAEQAAADAKRLPDWLFDFYKGGALDSAANTEFVKRFVSLAIPQADIGSFVDKTGGVSQEGVRRVANALFARAYGSPELLAALREGADPNIAAIGNAMIEAAPAWAKLRAEVAAGRTRPEMDITPALVEAANLVARARRQGVPVADLVRQGDVFSGGVSPMAQAALRLMYRDPEFRRPASKQAMVAALRYYADQAGRATTGGGLDLGDTAASPQAILDLAAKGGSGDLLGAAAEMRQPPAGDRITLAQAAARHTSPKRITLGQAEARAAASPASEAAGVGDALPTEGVAEMTPGANYVGQVRDRYDPAEVPTNDPIRRERIIADLVEGLGVPLYQGRIKSKRTLGFFRPHVGEVRIKNANDIETAAHEFAHLLDHKFPEIRQQWTPASNANAAVRAELRGVSYDKTKLYEGFAEFVRLWTTQTAEARARAPQFFGWFEDFVSRNEFGPVLRKAQTDMSAWFNQAALDRARSKIGGDADVNAGLTRVWDKFRQATVDDLHGIKNMEESLTGTLSPAGAYETARLTRAKSSIVDGMLNLGRIQVLPDGSHRFVGKGLKQILKPVSARLDDYLMYAVGRSANELMGQGREHLFTKAEIKAMLALKRPEFDRAFDEYQVWNKAVLDFAQAKGVIDPAARQLFARSQYLPFHRVGQPGEGTRVQGDWKGIKALTGGTGNLRDVLGNMIGNANTLTDAALTNEARQEVAKLAGKEGGASFMAKIPTEERGVKIPRDEIERVILDALGVSSKRALPADQQIFVDQIIDNLGGLVDVMLRGQAPTGRNVVAVLRQGKPEYYEVADPVLLRALTALKRPIAGPIVRLLAIPKRIGQATVTLTPDFMAANILRDTVMGGIMSRNGFRPIIDSAIGLKSRLTHDQNYKDFIANGGGLSSQLLDEKAFRRHLERYYGRKGINYRTVLDTPAKLLDGLEHIADAFEMATRLGEYRRAIQKGAEPRHAAYLAREVSTDFAMRGDSQALGALYDTVIFLKAGAVSLDRAYRGFTQDPNRARIAALTGLLALASAGLYAVNRNNPLYQQIEDWDRDANWHIFVPTPAALRAWSEGRDLKPEDAYLHLRLPKLWEIGAFSSIAERALEGILDRAPAETARRIASVAAQQFNLDPIPQAIRPLVELATNRDRFTGRPIETQSIRASSPSRAPAPTRPAWRGRSARPPRACRHRCSSRRHRSIISSRAISTPGRPTARRSPTPSAIPTSRASVSTRCPYCAASTARSRRGIPGTSPNCTTPSPLPCRPARRCGWRCTGATRPRRRTWRKARRT